MSIIYRKLQTFFKTRFDILFFYLFLLTSTLSVRKVLFYYPINNTFNEYTGVYIYLSDIFLILTFSSFILYNINTILSIIRNSGTELLALFHVEQCKLKLKLAFKNITFAEAIHVGQNKLLIVPRGTITLIKKTYAHIINHILTIFPLSIAFFSFFSILWTTNHTLATFRSVKILEFVLLYFYVITIVPRGTIVTNVAACQQKITKIINYLFSTIANRLFHVEQSDDKTPAAHCSTWNNQTENTIVPRGTIVENSLFMVVLVGIMQAIIGISQFIMQHSLGLFWLKESLISSEIAGVAKIVLDEKVLIRAYGLFPHPNILGGYLVFSIFATLLFKQLHCSTWNNANKHPDRFTEINTTVYDASQSNVSLYQLFHVEQLIKNNYLLRSYLGIQLIALVLTSSKSAILGLLLGLLYVSSAQRFQIVPRGTIYNKIGAVTKNINNAFKMFHVEHFKRKLLLIIAIVTLAIILVKPNINALLIQSLQERQFYLKIAAKTILTHPVIGVGAGQAILQLLQVPGIQTWQFQPVHDVFLLIASEYGLPMMGFFILFLISLFRLNANTISKKPIVPRGTTITKDLYLFRTVATYLQGLLLAIMFIMLFDHYPWDIQQGQILFWLITGLLAREGIHANTKQ